MINTTTSILEMARGAITEQVNVETAKIVANILDPNTAATKKRSLIVTVEFAPSADREKVSIKAVAKSKLEPNNAIETAIFVGTNGKGEAMATELTANIGGQITLDGNEEDEPKTIRLALNG